MGVMQRVIWSYVDADMNRLILSRASILAISTSAVSNTEAVTVLFCDCSYNRNLNVL